MFDTYKYLMGKKEENKEGSLLGILLKPYTALFRNSKEEPKEVGLEQVAQPKISAGPQKEEPLSIDKTSRAGKVLWKKK
ncbi:hypothetical protein FJZ53_03060 [Candidatus Woesearchaeota archaeon]|nr:hypothetical protein [Candidatus Woesearchaeota archaeon]